MAAVKPRKMERVVSVSCMLSTSRSFAKNVNNENVKSKNWKIEKLR